MRYKVIRDTKAYSKFGLSPDEKNGNEVGIVRAGFEFTAGAIQNGWLSILPNKWVKLLDCESLPETPPPDPTPTKAVIQIRRGVMQGEVITWTESPRTFEEI